MNKKIEEKLLNDLKNNIISVREMVNLSLNLKDLKDLKNFSNNFNLLKELNIPGEPNFQQKFAKEFGLKISEELMQVIKNKKSTKQIKDNLVNILNLFDGQFLSSTLFVIEENIDKTKINFSRFCNDIKSNPNLTNESKLLIDYIINATEGQDKAELDQKIEQNRKTIFLKNNNKNIP